MAGITTELSYESEDSDDFTEIKDWSDLPREFRQIFQASERGSAATLKLSLGDTSNATRLLLQRNALGRTALHYALNRDTAQVLVESVEPTKLKEFLWAKDQSEDETALDLAVKLNRADVAEYLCGFTSADETLLDGHLFVGHTPLHKARFPHMVRILVKSVPPAKRTTLLLQTDELQQIALHAAILWGRDKVVEYLCSLLIPQQLLYQDAGGNTVLHLANTKNSVELYFESLPDDSFRKTFALLQNNGKQTALHIMVQKRIEPSAVGYYLNNVSCREELLHMKDSSGRTALHYVSTEEIAGLLIDAAQDKSAYINVTDNEGKTALHHVRKQEIAQILIDAAQDKSTYIKSTDDEGKTALHHANKEKIANILVKAAQDASAYVSITDNEGKTALHHVRREEIANLLIDSAEDIWAYVSMTDNEGNTAVMSMIERGTVRVLRSTLECMDVEDVETALLMTNKKRQNIFHLACISPLVENLYDVLEEYLDCMSVADLLTSDIYKKTALTYLMGRFCTRIFAHFILKVPLFRRKQLLLQKDCKRVSCLSISQQKEFDSEYYMKRVVGSSEVIPHWELFKPVLHSTRSGMITLSQITNIFSPEKHFSNDEDLYKVMLYALNIYSLQDLHFSTHSQVTGHCDVSSAPEPSREQANDKSKKTLPSPILLWYDVDKKSLEKIQKELYELDVPDGHSGLRVIVVRYSTSDLVRYLSPPGPDFIIITLVSVHSDCDMILDLQTKSFQDIEDLLGCLKNMDGVKYININSTMAKNYGKPRGRQAEEVMLSSGASKGKALVISNRTDREKWEIEHEHVCCVLGEQLGLQVECLYDKSADDMLAAISEFSKSSGHGSLTAVCIMSHGDSRDNICGDDGKGLCSVQQVVDALCQSDIQSVTKMVFLSFCRGEISGRYNRTYNSWESTDLNRTAQLMKYNPIRRHLTQQQLDLVRRDPFPSVNVPVNCYICYSTLPDSLDFRWNSTTKKANKMCDCLSEHLTNIYKYNTLYKRVDSTHTLSYTADSESQVKIVDVVEMNISPLEQDVAVSTQQLLPRVEFRPLLIDVTGIVREKSEFTQYMNLCYAIDEDFKPLVVEILPAVNES